MDLRRTPRSRHGWWRSLTGLVALACLGLAVPWVSALEGPPANATVSFGAWQSDPALDRFPNQSPRERNEHQLLPRDVTIQAGGL
jgi:hypothetical protein